MSLQKQPNFQGRSNSNGRTKAYNRQLRQQPKWLSKEYKPVFKMPGSSDGDSKTI